MTQNAINNTASILAVDNLTLDGNTLSSTDTNGDIVLAPDGSGTVSVTTAPIVPSGDRADSLGSATNSWDNVYADGLTFDDGGNILSSYVGETAWTPALEFGGASTGITYTTQVGKYLRIGNFVQVYIYLVLSNKGSATGAATITGFPFTAMGNRQSARVSEYSNLTFTAGKDDASFIFVGATATISMREMGDNVAVANMDNVNFANNTVLNGLFGVIIT